MKASDLDFVELLALYRNLGDDDATVITVEYRPFQTNQHWKIWWDVQNDRPTQHASAASDWHPTLREAIRCMQERM